MKISHESKLRLRFSDFNSKICDFCKTLVITIVCHRERLRKNFISLDISVLGHEKSCLEVFEIRKKSLHLQPQTIKTMRYSMNIISLEPKVGTAQMLCCGVRYAHCSGN